MVYFRENSWAWSLWDCCLQNVCTQGQEHWCYLIQVTADASVLYHRQRHREPSMNFRFGEITNGSHGGKSTTDVTSSGSEGVDFPSTVPRFTLQLLETPLTPLPCPVSQIRALCPFHPHTYWRVFPRGCIFMHGGDIPNTGSRFICRL